MRTKEVEVAMADISELLEKLLADGTDVDFTPTGNSMRPLWHHRKDVVKLSAVDTQNVKKWDVLLYRRSSKDFVLHRVVAVNSESFDFLGDAQFGIERGVPKENTVAVVKAFKRGNGKWHTVHDTGYKVYVWLWCRSYALRYFLYRAYLRIKRMFNVSK